LPDSTFAFAVAAFSVSDGSVVVPPTALDQSGHSILGVATYAPWGILYAYSDVGTLACQPTLLACLQIGGSGEGLRYIVTSKGLVITQDQQTNQIKVYDSSGTFIRAYTPLYGGLVIDSRGALISADRTTLRSVDVATGSLNWVANIGTEGQSSFGGPLPHPNGCLYGLLLSSANIAAFGAICP
jgi:hypothetical protein